MVRRAWVNWTPRFPLDFAKLDSRLAAHLLFKLPEVSHVDTDAAYLHVGEYRHERKLDGPVEVVEPTQSCQRPVSPALRNERTSD